MPLVPSPAGQAHRCVRVCLALLLSTVALLASSLGIAAEPATDPPATQSPALTIETAVDAATARSASPEVADAIARAARERAVAAAQLPDPLLRLSLDNLPVDGPQRFSTTRDFMTMRSIELMQTFTREPTRQARANRLEREADAALVQRQARVAQVQRETAAAWFERAAAEQRLALIDAQRVEAGLQIEAAEAAQRGGIGSAEDVIVARDALAQLEQARIDARAAVTTARRRLARWTGRAPDQPLAPPPSIARVRVAEAGLESEHPDLMHLAAREDLALAGAAVAFAEREPDWSAQLMFSQRGSRYSNMVSLGVSLPLAWDRQQRQDREQAARLAEAAALRAEREELAREIRLQVQAWTEAWQAGLERLALIDRERDPLARLRVDAALGGYRGGSTALSEVLQARRAALALQLERIDVQLETARLWARLAYLIPERGASR